MLLHTSLSDQEIRRLIKHHLIRLGGNRKLKIYGKLNCRSGKRMKRENHVFFHSKEDALQKGFRPCGHCIRSEYKKMEK